MKNITKKSASYGYAMITIFLWGTLSTVSKILLNSMSAMFVLATESVISAVLLLFYNWYRGNLKEFKKCTVKDILLMGSLGFVGFFLYNWFYLMGIQSLLSQQAMIINYLWPVMIIVFSCIFLKEKLTVRKATAVLLAMAGVSIVAVNGDVSKLSGGNIRGVLCCLSAAVVYGFYAALNKKQTYHKELAMLVTFTVTAVISTICTLVQGIPDTLTTGMVAGLLYNGIFVNAIGYTCWMLALEYGKTAVISNLAYLTPFISLVMAGIVLKEPVSGSSIAGLLLIIGGIVIQMAAEENEKSCSTSRVNES